MQIAIQLYTLREACKEDFFGTLEKVAKLGYEGVEFAGFYGNDGGAVKEKLDELKLTAVSSHVSLEELTSNLDEVVSFHQILGIKNIVCPFTKWNTDKEFQEFVNVLSMVQEQISNKDLNLLYHNHDHELISDGKDLYLNQYMNQVPGLLMELDTYWASFASIDPVEYMKKHQARLELIHVKDMRMEEQEKKTAAVGTGILPISDIINCAKELDLKWIIVEDDFPIPDGLTNIQISIDNLRRMI